MRTSKSSSPTASSEFQHINASIVGKQGSDPTCFRISESSHLAGPIITILWRPSFAIAPERQEQLEQRSTFSTTWWMVSSD